jgi:hypothetical protein
MSIHTTLFLGVFPLSGLIWGWLADRLSEATVLAGGGVLVFFGAFVFGRGVLRHAPPAVALASAARGTGSVPDERDPAAPPGAAIGVARPESAAVGRN